VHLALEGEEQCPSTNLIALPAIAFSRLCTRINGMCSRNLEPWILISSQAGGPQAKRSITAIHESGLASVGRQRIRRARSKSV